MADSTTSVGSLAEPVIAALANVIQSSVSPDVLQAQQLLLRRMAIEGDVVSSRIPAPRNITEIGGYLNLLATLNQGELRSQMLASVLGVAGPELMSVLDQTPPLLFDVLRSNDRPSGAGQAAIPTQFSIRNDFALAFDTALKTIHDAGCMLPILSRPLPLPAATPGAPVPTDLLRYLGRTLDLVPSAALVDPNTDALAVAQLGAGALQVIARQSDAGAVDAASVASQTWSAWKVTAGVYSQDPYTGKYLELTLTMNTAGWYQAPLSAPTAANPSAWTRWTNTTGLVSGVSTFGDELVLRFTTAAISNSSLRNVLNALWNGTTFV